MEFKICSDCQIKKPISEFNKNKDRPDGHRSNCKICCRLKWKQKKYLMSKSRKNKLQEIKKDEILYSAYIKNQNKKNRNWWANKQGKTPDDIILNRELRKAQTLLNKELKKLYKNSTVKKGKIFYSEKYKDMRINNTQYKLKDNMRARIRKALKNQSTLKSKSTFELVGCTGAELTQHLLLLGYNKETDHVDHIVPLSRFDLTNLDHQLISCHYLNLQPLHFFDNCSKGDSLPENWQEIIIQICEVRNIESDSVIQYIQSGVKC